MTDNTVTISFGYILNCCFCNLYCDCLNVFCNVWMCVCVGVCMYGFCNVRSFLVPCVLVFTVFCIVSTVFSCCFV
jgi:hypothetical protein